MQLTKPQLAYLEVICDRGGLRSGWRGYRSTRVVRELERKGLAIVRTYLVPGSTKIHWTAHPTDAGIVALEQLDRR